MRKLRNELLEGLFWMAVATPVIFFLLGVKTLLTIQPASAYEDQGVYAFVAVSYEQIWEHRSPRSHRASTVHHQVTYETEDGRWQWLVDKPTFGAGNQAVQERETVERRVLSFVKKDGYITIDARYTPQEYVENQKRSAWILTGCSFAACAVEGGIWLLRRKKGKTP